MTFRHRLRVRYGECDPQGVVYFARYADDALVALWRERVVAWETMVQAGSDLVVAELALRYNAPARFDEELEVELVPTHLGTTSLRVAVRIERRRELLVEGELRHVCIDPATKRGRPLPDDVRAALEPLVAAGAAVA